MKRKLRKTRFCDHEKDTKRDIYRCFYCNKKLNKSIDERIKDIVHALGQEKRQRIMDLLRSGKTVGDVKKYFPSIDSHEWGSLIIAEVLTQNIKTYHYIPEQSV